MEKTVRISYYPILATKIGEREFTYKGRPNRPNLVVSDDKETTQYIATKLTIGDDEISIVHEPTTNYNRNITVRFDGISVEELDELKLGENKEITINTYIRKEPIAAEQGVVGGQQLPTFRRLAESDEIVFSYTKPPTTEPIIEGACSSKKQKETDKALGDLRKQYDSLLDMLNSLKGSGSVNTTYQYMAPDGDMSCQLMEDTSSKDVNVFRQAIYEDKTIKDHEKKNKKLSDAATAMSIGMFIMVAIILMFGLLLGLYLYWKAPVTVALGATAVDASIRMQNGFTGTFVVFYILGLLLLISETTNTAGKIFLSVTACVMLIIMIFKKMSPISAAQMLWGLIRSIKENKQVAWDAL
jgi:hypothetical protein